MIATYSKDEWSMDLVVELASNHPLQVINIECSNPLNVDQSQWRKWLMQLTAFITHQVGHKVRVKVTAWSKLLLALKVL